MNVAEYKKTIATVLTAPIATPQLKESLASVDGHRRQPGFFSGLNDTNALPWRTYVPSGQQSTRNSAIFKWLRIPFLFLFLSFIFFSFLDFTFCFSLFAANKSLKRSKTLFECTYLISQHFRTCIMMILLLVSTKQL